MMVLIMHNIYLLPEMAILLILHRIWGWDYLIAKKVETMSK